MMIPKKILNLTKSTMMMQTKCHSMSLGLQKTFENTWAYEMNQQPKEMFQAKASNECLDVVKSLLDCKPKPGASIFTFVLERKGYFDRLESLNMVFDAELSININLFGSKGMQKVESWRAQLRHGKQENQACDKDWKVRA
nr:hypothetical protein [Tanacetum cinerariifolium]